jgi:predicted class III extradiol MEMO1 family dioxygenase
MGMEIIETGDPVAFKQYLQEYENTICGRHPISVFLHVCKPAFLPMIVNAYCLSFILPCSHPVCINYFQMLKHCSTKIKIGFVRYEQSSQCKSMRDSSVSYASAAAKVDTSGEEEDKDE